MSYLLQINKWTINIIFLSGLFYALDASDMTAESVQLILGASEDARITGTIAQYVLAGQEARMRRAQEHAK